MIKNLTDSSLSKRKLLELIKERINEEKKLHLRSVLSEDSFEKPDWSKYLAYQLGCLAVLEKLDNFIPDPGIIND
jgi:hypothetical protein